MGNNMQTFTWQEITRRLGISPDDLVHFRRQGDKGIIEVKLKSKRPEKGPEGTPDLFGKIYSMSENVGIDDWALNHDHYLYGTPKHDEEEFNDG
jgi:hypothetical protein